MEEAPPSPVTFHWQLENLEQLSPSEVVSIKRFTLTQPTSFHTIRSYFPYFFTHFRQLPAHYVNLFLHSVASLTEEQEQRFGWSHTGDVTEEGLLCGCCDLR